MAVPTKLKDKLLVEACHACVICSNSRVQIHHIDGNKENNDESNLIVLCVDHHDEAEMSKEGRSFTANLTIAQLRLYKEKQKQELFYKKRVEKGVDLEWLLPLPPMPYVAHRYILHENFTGRLSERDELTQWFTNGDKPMFAYVAIGGMGKSALTWYWLHEDIIKKGLAPEGIIWWSFYDREARFETFLMKAIQYASEGKIDAKEIPSTRDKMDALYKLLCEKRFLLVLDGVERVLMAYAGSGSPYQGDEVKVDKEEIFGHVLNHTLVLFYNG